MKPNAKVIRLIQRYGLLVISNYKNERLRFGHFVESNKYLYYTVAMP
ncbi:hypothetical protein PBV87_20285 [Niameybacter massiliensis]|uniref:Uncharacterized protein n=1 Tax=Holtiella tumoricola TaxID=3018743 RepID=A0AA42DR60_9FIRM|nr:hypothetical protein [Holtiella tumoricola]MDA3733815.1 hypothetical protein [Holtiella tumoricola]